MPPVFKLMGTTAMVDDNGGQQHTATKTVWKEDGALMCSLTQKNPD